MADLEREIRLAEFSGRSDAAALIAAGKAHKGTRSRGEHRRAAMRWESRLADAVADVKTGSRQELDRVRANAVEAQLAGIWATE